MSRVRSVLRAIRIARQGTVALVCYVRRRRMRAEGRPALRVQFAHSPSWGAEHLAVSIENTGGGKARDCRYCRLQEFTMAAPEGSKPAFSRRRWYSTDSFTVAAAASTRSIAVLTLDESCRWVLSDLVGADSDEGGAVDAIVCRDTVGTLYRFVPGDEPEIWSPGLIDGYAHRFPPTWAAALSTGEKVISVAWDHLR